MCSSVKNHDSTPSRTQALRLVKQPNRLHALIQRRRGDGFSVRTIFGWTATLTADWVPACDAVADYFIEVFSPAPMVQIRPATPQSRRSQPPPAWAY